MDEYYVNKKAQTDSGDHEVHVKGCSHFPEDQNAKYLGDFLTCDEAIIEAHIYYQNVDGCYWCCRPCNKG